MAMFFGSAPISAGEVSSGVRQKSRFVENRERTADQALGHWRWLF